MDRQFDVIIVGSGPAGIFCAYELMELSPNKRVLLVEKGVSLRKRQCPILKGRIQQCPTNPKGYAGCYPHCSITSGFGGAGAFSDGKFNITSEFGGWMSDYLTDATVQSLIEHVDSIMLNHGAPQSITDPQTPFIRTIEKEAISHGLKLLRARVRHLGTENNLDIQQAICDTLAKHVSMRFSTEVDDIVVENDTIKGITLSNGEVINAEHVVLAPGRDGASWLDDLCATHGIVQTNNTVDIGVRVETSNAVMETINEHLYEGKFVYQSSLGTRVRTFCSNPSGHVVIENHSGTMLANGHAYHDAAMGSDNTNFALLVSHDFDSPFREPNKFAHSVSKLANMLSDGSIIVQSYGDLTRGRRSTDKRIKESFITPTLKEARPGDLSLALPYNTLASIREMIEKLNMVTPGVASPHTLLYGVEAKFYSARPKMNDHFESPIHNLYFAGDGAGLTRGLAQSSASGVHVARAIIDKEGNQ